MRFGDISLIEIKWWGNYSSTHAHKKAMANHSIIIVFQN